MKLAPTTVNPLDNMFGKKAAPAPAPAPEPVPAPAPVPEPAPALAPELYEKQLRAAPSALLYGAVALLRRQDGGTVAATLVPQQQLLLAVPASTP